jgi:hypothetical protein
LPEADVIRTIGVIVLCIGIASRLVRGNAFAAALIPGILGTPGGNINFVFVGSTVAFGAFS